MVIFKIAGGERVPEIEMSLSDTIFDLKQKIETELDVEVDRQSLWHNNRMLMDHEVIRDFGFGASETLDLTVTSLLPEHKLNGTVTSMSDGCVSVKETDKVSDLRAKISRHCGIPSKFISLTRCNVVMKDNLPLSAYYVNDGSEVQVKIITEPR